MKHLAVLLEAYESRTPGVELLDNATTILGEESEPQPDLALRILSAYGGQSRETDRDYVAGPPELIVEVAHSTRAIDMHQKLLDYQRAGVREYLVVLVRRKLVRWFVRREGSFQDLAPRSDGIFCSETFGGLWLDPEALLRDDSPRVIEVLNQGLASPAHAEFLARLRRP